MILVATIAFPWNCRHCAPVAQETRGFEGFLRCERTPCVPETFRLSQRRQRTCENTHSSSLGWPLFCTRERCTDLCVVIVAVVVVHEGWLFLKKPCPTLRIRHENKNRMRRHTIFHNYCHYYYRMMTVVTTVATWHGITTSLYHVG